MSASSRVTVVIVSFNTCDLLRRCLRCIEPEHEIVVVDNASSDGSADMVAREFPGVRLIRNDQNRGFGGANNQGIDVASRELVLLLNSDAFAKPGAIGRLAEAFDDPTIVAAGGKLLNEDGTRQASTARELTLWAAFCEQLWLEKAFPGSRVLSPYWLEPSGEQDVPQVMGACLMMRKLERFDDRYFLYCEDTDLCHRMACHGRIRYVPDAEFVHLLGSSSHANRWLAVARYNRGKELYFAIHRSRVAWLICLKLNRIGALLRMLAWLVVQISTLGSRGRGQVRLFARVLGAPISGPPRPDGKPR